MKQIYIPDQTHKLFTEKITGKDSEILYTVGHNCDITLVLVLTGTAELNCQIILSEPDSRINIIGLLKGEFDDIFSLHTLQHHQAPDTASSLLVKSVLDGSAKFEFDGVIRVEPAAHGTDAYQRNENLLLSSDTVVVSKPTLEISAHDVRCTHAAFVSQVSDEQLWYLKSRGIPPEKATGLITGGFFTSALDHISDRNAARNAIRSLKIGI